MSTSTVSSDDFDTKMMNLALSEARKCTPKVPGFSVGCVLVAQVPGGSNTEPAILSTGYSRELEGNTHAEANALEKLHRLSAEELRGLFPPVHDDLSLQYVLQNTAVYTTMEPCSIRTSGLAPCADALIAAHIPRCVIGVGEPDDFVNCEGAKKLTDAGVEVVWLKGMEELCLTVARSGHGMINESQS